MICLHLLHAFHIQSVVTPNGLIAHLFGPIEGRRHDAFHAIYKWATKQADTFQPAQQQSICVVWGSNIWSIHPHPVSFLWPALNTTATGVQPSHECCAGVCRVDLWEDYTVFRISGLQEESESLVATSWQVLPCRGNSNELSHMFAWIANNNFF